MAHLRNKDGQIFPLETNHLVGRARNMNTVLPYSEVSTQHLAISWDGQEWSLRDLASRNGTWVNGRKLATGELVSLQAGAQIGVGSAATSLTLVDAAPPCAFAVSGTSMMEGETEFLALPSADNPLVLFELDPEQGWVQSEGDEQHPVESGLQIEMAGQNWRVALPEPVTRTTDGRVVARTGVALQFRVSSNEEYIEVSLRIGEVTHRLAARAHHEILLNLARSRLEDTELSVGERGWIYTADLMKMSRLSSNQLYVGLHRLRKEFEAIDEALGAGLFERRPTSHQIRLSVDDLAVEPI